MRSLFYVFKLFYLILENMSTNVKKIVFLVIFNNYDVVYNWSISLMSSIVSDNLVDSQWYPQTHCLNKNVKDLSFFLDLRLLNSTHFCVFPCGKNVRRLLL